MHSLRDGFNAVRWFLFIDIGLILLAVIPVRIYSDVVDDPTGKKKLTDFEM